MKGVGHAHPSYLVADGRVVRGAQPVQQHGQLLRQGGLDAFLGRHDQAEKEAVELGHLLGGRRRARRLRLGHAASNRGKPADGSCDGPPRSMPSPCFWRKKKQENVLGIA